MDRRTLLAQARACLRSVEVYYLRRDVPLLVTVAIPRRMERVSTKLRDGQGRALTRELTSAFDVLLGRQVIRLHPQLAVDKAPRYVLHNIMYAAGIEYIASVPPQVDDGGRKHPPQVDKCNAWLAKHDYPTLRA